MTAGLGCEGWQVSAELYKMLVYDRGGFFVAHRDTEKAEGMFGTLVVVLLKAAEQADCVAHLGIVHLEEYGSAEPAYDSHRYRR